MCIRYVLLIDVFLTVAHNKFARRHLGEGLATLQFEFAKMEVWHHFIAWPLLPFNSYREWVCPVFQSVWGVHWEWAARSHPLRGWALCPGWWSQWDILHDGMLTSWNPLSHRYTWVFINPFYICRVLVFKWLLQPMTSLMFSLMQLILL